MIYLDNAATTRVTEDVFEAMKPFFLGEYANPSAIYGFAGKANAAVEEARQNVAALINAKKEEIYFTAGGSEADNWAIKAVVEAAVARAAVQQGKGTQQTALPTDKLNHRPPHIITSAIEHHAVLHTCQYLEKQGCEVTYVGVNDKGVININELKAAIRPETVLISVMSANNEIGTIQPLEEIGRIAKEKGILFHTDAVQAYGHIPVDVQRMNIDLLSASAHKLHGPKGIGMLYVRKGTKIGSFIHGGAQENKKRAGTLNTAGIVGFGKAAENASENMADNIKKQSKLRDYLIDKVLKTIPYSRVNGDLINRLPGNAHFCFRFIEGEAMLMMLDRAGICASSGSACTSGSLDPSHVLLAIGLPHEIAHGSLRLTLSEDTTKEDIDYTVEQLECIIARLREMSPLYEDFVTKEAGK